MYRNLDQSIGYLFIYARDMLKNVCLLSPKALSEKGETDVNKVYAKFTEISFTASLMFVIFPNTIASIRS